MYMRQKFKQPSVELVVYGPEDDSLVKGIKDAIRGATFVSPQGRLTAVQALTQLQQVQLPVHTYSQIIQQYINSGVETPYKELQC